MCAQWVCVVRVHDTRGVCVWRAWGGRRLGLPSQASHGPVPRGLNGVEIPSLCIQMSNHQVIYFKYFTILFVNYASIKFEKKNRV